MKAKGAIFATRFKWMRPKIRSRDSALFDTSLLVLFKIMAGRDRCVYFVLLFPHLTWSRSSLMAEDRRTSALVDVELCHKFKAWF